jgi:hypothetical protein
MAHRKGLGGTRGSAQLRGRGVMAHAKRATWGSAQLRAEGSDGARETARGHMMWCANPAVAVLTPLWIRNG